MAKKELGWEPNVMLNEGLGKTVEYFDSLKLKRYRKPTDHVLQ